jgi:hypothetical protein
MIYYFFLGLILFGILSSFYIGMSNKKFNIKKEPKQEIIPQAPKSQPYIYTKEYGEVRKSFLKAKETCIKRLVSINKLLHEINDMCKK